jgi:hypothetical protein
VYILIYKSRLNLSCIKTQAQLWLPHTLMKNPPEGLTFFGLGDIGIVRTTCVATTPQD